MNLNAEVNIWLKDGSIFKGWVLVIADIKISGFPFDINILQKLDDAFLYTTNESKIYRDRVTGSIDVRGSGLKAPLKLDLTDINVMTEADLEPVKKMGYEPVGSRPS